MANSENSKFNVSHYAGQRKNLQRKKLGEGITGLTPSHEEATSNKFDGLPENFNETVFLETLNKIERRKEQKKELDSVTRAHSPIGIVTNAFKDAVGSTFSRTPIGKVANSVGELMRERRARQQEIDAENERNAVLTTMVATGACTLANHFEKLHIITSPIIWFVNIIGQLCGQKTPLVITKMVSYKKVEYFTLGVQKQYQMIFMIGILGLSWYITFRCVAWFKGFILPDERLKM